MKKVFKKEKSLKIFVIFLFYFLGVIGFFVGSASFLIRNNIDVNDGISPIETSEPVCYIKSTYDYYTTIEKALEDAANLGGSQQVYVITGTNPVITRQCIIANGVQLILPYDGETFELDSGSDSSYTNGIDNTTNRVIQLTINDIQDTRGNYLPTLTIEYGGELIIGGKRRNTSPQGATGGLFAEVVLDSNAIIDCYGTINCLGYIKEGGTDYNGSVINVFDNGVVKEPLIAYDWSSAGNALAAVSANIFPFNKFDFSQISPTLKLFSGCRLYGDAWFYGSTAKDMKAEAIIIGKYGDASLISPRSTYKNTDYILFKNTDVSSGTNLTSDYAKKELKIIVSGEYQLESIKMDLDYLIPIKIDSSKYQLPFGSAFNITLSENTVFDINESIKFLPGSKIIIEKNSTANLNAECMFYETNTNSSGNKIYNYSTSTSARIINNGYLNINSGFGGYIECGEDGIVNDSFIKTGNIYAPTFKEIISYSGGIGGLFTSANTVDFSFISKIDCIIGDNATSLVIKSLDSNATYYFDKLANEETGWRKLKNITVNFKDFNGNTILSDVYDVGSVINNLADIYKNYYVYSMQLVDGYYQAFAKDIKWYIQELNNEPSDSLVVDYDGKSIEYNVIPVYVGEAWLYGEYITCVDNSTHSEISSYPISLVYGGTTYYVRGGKFTLKIEGKRAYGSGNGYRVDINFENGTTSPYYGDNDLIFPPSKYHDFTASYNFTFVDA